MNTAHVLNFVNLVLCFAWGWSAMCRLSLMQEGVPLRVALLYLALFVGSVFSGLQFYIFGTLAGWPDVFASVMICALLGVSVSSWRHAPSAGSGA
jgi:hypothetical protein